MSRSSYADLKEVLKKLGVSEEHVSRSLGKAISIKELIDRVRPELIESLVEHYAKMLVTSSRDCRTSYCITSKMSSIFSRIVDLKEIMDWNPTDVFESVLFHREVLQSAPKWPVEQVLHCVEKPQFRSLREVRDVLQKWLREVRSAPSLALARRRDAAVRERPERPSESTRPVRVGELAEEEMNRGKEEVGIHSTKIPEETYSAGALERPVDEDIRGKIIVSIVLALIGLMMIIFGLMLP